MKREIRELEGKLKGLEDKLKEDGEGRKGVKKKGELEGRLGKIERRIGKKEREERRKNMIIRGLEVKEGKR